jgi:ankyrin repeat protein
MLANADSKINLVMWAVENKRFTTIRRFLENGANINNDRMFRTYVKQKGKARSWSVGLHWHELSVFTLLALAAAFGLDSMVSFLLDHGADIEKAGKGLCVCADGYNLFELRFPPDENRGGTDEPEYIMGDENGFAWTPLHFALCRGHESTAMLLLERGANPRETCPCESGPWNALHTATRLNQRKVIDYILKNKLVDINDRGHEGLTPLLIAYYEEHYSLVDLYVERGADIKAVWDSKDGGWTMFAMTCLRGDWPRATFLLRRGADPDFVLKEEGGEEWTALGLVYGGLYGDWPHETGCIDSSGYYATGTVSRRLLEQQIFQVKVDKALQQQAEEPLVQMKHRRRRSC